MASYLYIFSKPLARPSLHVGSHKADETLWVPEHSPTLPIAGPRHSRVLAHLLRFCVPGLRRVLSSGPSPRVEGTQALCIVLCWVGLQEGLFGERELHLTSWPPGSQSKLLFQTLNSTQEI